MTIANDKLGQRRASAVALYRRAKEVVIGLGFGGEITWQDSLDPSTISETVFLRESAWVILCSGFREAIVHRIFSQFSLCFLEWESAELISMYRKHCRAAALCCFGNPQKLDAIIRIADHIAVTGFAPIKEAVLKSPIETLQAFPYIGRVTARHLAKNLGIPVAKPDRHLERLASGAGYNSVDALCQEISEASGDSVQVVDVVLWRYSERLGSERVYS